MDLFETKTAQFYSEVHTYCTTKGTFWGARGAISAFEPVSEYLERLILAPSWRNNGSTWVLPGGIHTSVCNGRVLGPESHFGSSSFMCVRNSTAKHYLF